MLRRIGKTGTLLLSLCAAVQPVGAQEPPLPPGTTACAISGYAISRNRAGTPVRAEPDKAAKILGRLAPPQKAREPDFEFVPPSDEVWRTQFSIIGFRPGWMLIEKALHPYDDPDRRGALGRRSTGGVKTYAGRAGSASPMSEANSAFAGAWAWAPFMRIPLSMRPACQH